MICFKIQTKVFSNLKTKRCLNRRFDIEDVPCSINLQFGDFRSSIFNLVNRRFKIDGCDSPVYSDQKVSAAEDKPPPGRGQGSELLAAESGGIGLQSVFLAGKLVGGADEIRRLNGEGLLEKMVENSEKVDGEDGGGGSGGNGGVSEACGDVRFLPCETCSGSCKIYYDADYEEEEEEEEEEECGFQRCPNCNENGLIRCPIYCSDCS